MNFITGLWWHYAVHPTRPVHALQRQRQGREDTPLSRRACIKVGILFFLIQGAQLVSSFKNYIFHPYWYFSSID